MSKNLPREACKIGPLSSYSSAMRIALQNRTPELEKLLDRFRERRELVPFKARALKGLAAELGAAYGIGLPWKEIWRALAECGYEGSYRQFWRMAVRLTGTSAQKPQRRKNLPPPVVGKEVHQPKVRESGLSTESTEDKEKPEWQVQREAGNGETGSRSGTESPAGVAVETDEGFQAERLCGAERGLNAALEMKPKRVVFPIAGKGGVGKTTVMATLAEWYASTAYTAELFDMDPDNKAEGCFKALFAKAHKLPALESWTYDKLLGISLESSADVILADLGRGTRPSDDSLVPGLL